VDARVLFPGPGVHAAFAGEHKYKQLGIGSLLARSISLLAKFTSFSKTVTEPSIH
jgi:hypothetical protein